MGLYCSYRCASMAEPFKRPQDAPRWCTTDKSGKTEWKKRLRHEGELPRALKDDPSAGVYWCKHCGFLHIGHNRVELAVDKTRRLGSMEDVADVLVKYRESRGWTQKEAAQRIGIRPIRLKELEEGNKAATWDALFATLDYYRIRLAAVFK